MLARRSLVDDFFDGMESLLFTFHPAQMKQSLPEVTISQDENNTYLKCIVPGFNEEDIKVEVKDSTLIVSAQKDEKTESQDHFSSSSRSFRRSWSLDNICEESISAEYKAGVLVVTLPRREVAQSTARQIPIAIGTKALGSG